MKLNSAMSKFLTNKLVLNVVAFLALFNVIGYAVMGNLNATAYFIVFAILVRYFSKNMTIVLGVPLIIVNLLAMRGNILEGMENKNKNNDDKLVTKPVEQEEEKNIDKSTTTSVINNSAASTVSTSPDNPAQDTGDKQGFESGRRKNRGNDIDYATTIEDAYDELNNILGSDGIQRLTSDTQGLMKQQMQLAESMKGMEPLVKGMMPMIEQMKGMMKTMDGNGEGGLSDVMEMAKKLTKSTAQ